MSLRLARLTLLLPPVLFALLALYGCQTVAERKGPPTITFDATAFLKVYFAERDQVIRETAPAVKKCAKVTPASPLDQRTACAKLDEVRAEWERRDAVVYGAILTGSTVSGIDWEKAAELAAKLIGLAGGIAL